MLSVLFDFIEQTELDFDNPETILGNENLPNALKGLGEALKDTSFLDLLLGLLQDTLDDTLASSDDLGALKEILERMEHSIYSLTISKVVYQFLVKSMKCWISSITIQHMKMICTSTRR